MSANRTSSSVRSASPVRTGTLSLPRPSSLLLRALVTRILVFFVHEPPFLPELLDLARICQTHPSISPYGLLAPITRWWAEWCFHRPLFGLPTNLIITSTTGRILIARVPSRLFFFSRIPGRVRQCWCGGTHSRSFVAHHSRQTESRQSLGSHVFHAAHIIVTSQRLTVKPPGQIGLLAMIVRNQVVRHKCPYPARVRLDG